MRAKALRNRRWVVLDILSWPSPLWAHEGHGGKEVGPYDLDSPRQVSPETAAHLGLKTAEVDFGAIDDKLDLSGIVRAVPDRNWAISALTAGKVLAVHVQVGSVVRRGDLLVEIDSPKLARLLLDVVRGEGRVQQLRVEAANSDATATLRARGEAKYKAVELDVTTKEVAVLRQQALRWSRDASGDQSDSFIAELSDGQPLNLLRLVAPADGVVVERNARPGLWADAGETLLSVADYSVVQIEGELPKSLLPRVLSRSSDAARVRIPAQPAFIVEGRIKFMHPGLDPVKRTAHVVIDCKNNDRMLRDGMFVDLAIVLREEKSAVAVPASAVIPSGPMHFVFLMSGDTYKKQDITPGFSDDQVVEVLGGLAPGDVVVTQGDYSLTQLRPKADGAVAASPPAPTSLHEHG